MTKRLERPKAKNVAEGLRKRSLGMLSLTEIAEMLGVTRASVSKTHKRAIEKLRKHPVMVALAEEVGL